MHAKTIRFLGSAVLAAALLPSCAGPRAAVKPAPSPGGACSTRYPILLVHGLSLRDDHVIPYWGRIPGALSAQGARVYLASHDAWASIEDNAASLGARVAEILAETGEPKVNIIAHSKGGLESRYLISTLKRGDAVASLTTICTPHRGAPFAALVLDEVPILNETTGMAIDLVSLFFLRDGNPNVKWAVRQLTPESLADFNLRNPDDPRVFYQSWASAIDGAYGNPSYTVLQTLTFDRAGPNDGVVPVESAKWGDYRGLVGDGRQVSHSDVHDYRVFSVPDAYDVVPFYVEMAAGLKRRGF